MDYQVTASYSSYLGLLKPSVLKDTSFYDCAYGFELAAEPLLSEQIFLHH